MGAVLSEDLRKRVVTAVEAGASPRQAAKRFGVSLSSARLWLRQWRRHGHVAAKPQGGDRRSHRIEAQADYLLKQIEQTPDATLQELQAQLHGRGLSVGIGTVWRFFRRHGISFKKTLHADEQHQPEVARRREAWTETQATLDPARLLFLPPYSPDFNPTEPAFSKLKGLLRQAAARTVEGLWQAVAEALDAFSPEEGANYFRNTGYGSN